MLELFEAAGLYKAPTIQLPTDSLPQPKRLDDPGRAALGLEDLGLNPLQAALAVTALTYNGYRPSPSLVIAMNTAQSGWVILSEPSSPAKVLTPGSANATANALAQDGQNFWQTLTLAEGSPGQSVTWFVGGTLSSWSGPPLVVAIVLETNDPALAQTIGQAVFNAALQPNP